MPLCISACHAGESVSNGSPIGGSILVTVAPACFIRATARGPGTFIAIVTIRIPARNSVEVIADLALAEMLRSIDRQSSKTMASSQSSITRIESERIGADDPRYRAVLEKQFNKRFRAQPDYVRFAASREEVVAAVEEAVGEQHRLVVTSGGHCLEGFVSDPEVRVIVDVSPMKRIYYDTKMRAIAVECGATVGETFRALLENWGVVVPLGEYPAIGMGGHVVGGAFGFLCRQLGLAADYLYAVEVVIVDGEGRARAVVATRETSDPNREL